MPLQKEGSLIYDLFDDFAILQLEQIPSDSVSLPFLGGVREEALQQFAHGLSELSAAFRTR